MTATLNPQRIAPGSYRQAVEGVERKWSEAGLVSRLWRRDPSVWTDDGEGAWLGWLDVVSRQLAAAPSLSAFRSEIEQADFSHVVVLGMGGSSLCPEVLGRTFGKQPGFPELLVLDSTVPARVRFVEAQLDLARTLFIVASKSGSTAEPDAFERYFFERVGDASRFVAITDPGSALEQHARSEGYRRVWHGEPEIGGRFSALSHFGMVPAATMGLDVSRLLTGAKRMEEACRREDAVADNPGVSLGLALGALALSGCEKVTFQTSPELRSLGAWLEQLIAESTGKDGKGILPVDLEPAVSTEMYGPDRVFVRIVLAGASEPPIVRDHPSVTIELSSLHDLAQEFFRWEVATAVMGAVIGVNPFDQPDVEASKVETRALLERYASGAPGDDGGGGGSLSRDELRAHVDGLRPGDYFAINAYVNPEPEVHEALQRFRRRVLEEKGVATTLGYGPRFLHSTGQLHKGGPASGVFLQITADDPADLSIPGKPYSFGALKRCQAEGDGQVLQALGRRFRHLHVEGDVAAALDAALDLP